MEIWINKTTCLNFVIIILHIRFVAKQIFQPTNVKCWFFFHDDFECENSFVCLFCLAITICFCSFNFCVAPLSSHYCVLLCSIGLFCSQNVYFWEDIVLIIATIHHEIFKSLSCSQCFSIYLHFVSFHLHSVYSLENRRNFRDWKILKLV